MGLAGMAMPPTALAHTLRGPEDLPAAVITGIWVLKGALLLLAALIWWAPEASRTRWSSGALLADTSARSSEEGPSTPSTRATWLVLAGTLLLGAGLRLYGLETGLWFDELQTLSDYARHPFGYILTTYDSQNNHLLYSVLSHGTYELAPSAWGLRLPAALFGIASLGALYAFAVQVTNRREALLATALLTVSYHHVWFSQNARGYTGLLLFTLLASLFFLKLLTDESRQRGRWPALYGVSIALALYTHLTAVFVVAAHGLLWLMLVARSRPRAENAGAPLAGLLWAAVLSLLLYAMVLPQVAGTVFGGTAGAPATEWQNPLWMVTEAVRGLARGLPGGGLVLALGLAVAGAGLWSYWRQSRAVVALMVLPGVLTVAAIVALSHNLWPRFFFFSAGFAVLVLLRGIFAALKALWPTRATVLGTAVAGLAIVASATTLPTAYLPKQDFEGAAAFVEEGMRSERGGGGAVVTVDLTRYVYREYLDYHYEAVESLPELLALEARYPSVWVLYTFPVRLSAVQPEIWRHLHAAYDTAAVFPGTVGGGAVTIMVRQ